MDYLFDAPPRFDRYNDEEDDKPVGDYFFPTLERYGSPIVIPTEEAFNFEVKSGFIQSVTSAQYPGYGSPSDHLTNFYEICSMYKPRDVPIEFVYLKLFPISLSGEAKDWFLSHRPNTFQGWKKLANAFMAKFYSAAKTREYTEQIINFKQARGETFHGTYDRFGSLLRKCPHHGFTKPQLMIYFYQGLKVESRGLIDTASGGAIMDLSATRAFRIVERIATNSSRYQDYEIESEFPRAKDNPRYVTTDQYETLLEKFNDIITILGTTQENKKGKIAEDIYYIDHHQHSSNPSPPVCNSFHAFLSDCNPQRRSYLQFVIQLGTQALRKRLDLCDKCCGNAALRSLEVLKVFLWFGLYQLFSIGGWIW